MGNIIYNFLKNVGFTDIETKFAAWLGTTYRNYWLKNRPLTGTPKGIHLTRGKIKGQSRNVIYRGYANPIEVKVKGLPDEVYEVVYQTFMNGHLLSLFHTQLWMIGKKIKITEYGCIIHIGHRFVGKDGAKMGSDVEIYPQEIQEIEI